MKPRSFLWTCMLICVVSAFGTPGLAQTTGSIRGTVKDPSGAVVPNAKITATLAGTDTTRTVPADKDGDYEFVSLPVGHYTLEVEAPGFKKFVQKEIVVDIARVVLVNAVLQVGSSTQTVAVEASAMQVEITSTQLGAVMNDIAVQQLPLNARDTYQLLQLQPGVQSQLGSNLFYGSDQAGVVSVNGGRGRSNNYTVNGGDANDIFVNLPAIQPSPDAIEQFRVLTNTFDAEFGRNSGAVVNVVTKSGTNDFHGDIFEFFRNKVLNARGFFNTVKPDSKQNQFGGTLGGPIRKDRTFIFGSYEGRRVRKGISSDVVTAPTAAELAGDFAEGGNGAFVGALSDNTVASILNSRCGTAITNAGGMAPAVGVTYASMFPGNRIPTQCFDPVALNLFNQFISPLDATGTGTIQTVPVGRDRGDQFTIRLDHKINERQQFSAYYYFNDLAQFQPFSFFQAAGANVPGFGDFNATRVQQWNLSHTWSIGTSAVNEFRFSYFREGQGQLDHPQRTNSVTNSCTGAGAAFCFNGSSDTPLVDANGNPIPTPNARLGITPGLGPSREGVPFVTVSGGFILGNNFEGELPQIGNTFQWADNFSKVIGKHSLKFGADARRMRFDQTLFFAPNGEFFFSGTGGTVANDPGLLVTQPDGTQVQNLFPNYFLGLPDSYFQGSAQSENVRATAVYLFAQDSWKIKPNLTLNYGLRWELDSPIYDRRNRVQTFRPGQPTSIYPCQLPAQDPANPTMPNPLVVAFGTTNCNPGSAGQAVFPLGLVVPGDKGIPPGLTKTYFKAFAPRIGLAWSPGWSEGWLSKLFGGPGKSSIRMGYGIFYNPVEQLVLEQFSAEPPFGGSSGFSDPLFQMPFVLQSGSLAPNPFNGILNPRPSQSVDWSRFRPIVLFGEFQPNMRTQYAEQYNLTIQRELPGSVLFQIGYVGSQGHRLLASRDINPGNPRTCNDLAALGQACGPFGEDSAYSFMLPAGSTLHLPYAPPAAPNGPNIPCPPNPLVAAPAACTVTGAAAGTPITLVGIRPFSSPFCDPLTGNNCPPDGTPVFSSTFAQDTIGNSNYHSLQVMVEKRFAKGLQFQGAYTFSKSIDNASSFEDLLNPFNYRLSRSLSLFDARHRFVFSYYWQPPVPKYSGFAGKLANGWGFSGIVTYQTGFPIRLGISSSSALTTNDQELLDGSNFDFETAGEPNIVAPFHTLDPRKSPNHLFFDPSIFALQAPGTVGNAPRAICCGPSISQSDLAVLKSTPVTERLRTEFRVEFFNTWNHTQFLSPDGNPADATDFGRVKRARDPREIQFALKFIF